MNLGNHPNTHLTYCSNIHPGETWGEVLTQLKNNLPELKERLSPEEPFGVGLRLSAEAAGQLLQGDNLQDFKKWLENEDLYLFTINGFPYGSFHRERVKDDVYKPDWTSSQRVNYTFDLIEILSKLLPEGLDGGISTSPLSYKPWLSESQYEDIFRISSRNLAEIAFKMHEILEEQGKLLHVDIEPEPDCLIENARETVKFFKDWLFKAGAAHLAVEYGLGQDDALEILKEHIRVCYDTCHFAVEYEDPQQTVNAFREAGIKIGKVQISAAIKVEFSNNFSKIVSKLKPFEEDTYLHQVIERRSGGALHHYPDLSEAISQKKNKKAEEWRIHYHVPIFVKEFGILNSTQDDIIRSLNLLLGDSECTHFEIETYTWDVLPKDLKEDLIDSIEREFRWTLDHFNN